MSLDKPKRKNKPGAGRPRKVLDTKLLVQLARIHCTNEEIADMLQCDVATLTKNYSELIKESRAWGKRSLRRAQFANAIKHRNAALQIWLGKVELGQRDTTLPAPSSGSADETHVLVIDKNGSESNDQD